MPPSRARGSVFWASRRCGRRRRSRGSKHAKHATPPNGGERVHQGGAWETADRYLSGNVRAKLVAAQSSARLDPAYERNVEARQAVHKSNRGKALALPKIGRPRFLT